MAPTIASTSERARVCVPGGQVLAGLHGRRVAAAARRPGADSGWGGTLTRGDGCPFPARDLA